MPTFESAGKMTPELAAEMQSRYISAEVDWDNKKQWGDMGSIYDAVVRQPSRIDKRAKLFVPEVENPERFVDRMVDDNTSRDADTPKVWEFAEKICFRSELGEAVVALLVSDDREQWGLVRWR